ncbi:MAG TPA: thiol reductant ABC exporter subunit CydC, partial [Marinobacter sp.]|nr:thiol reductant ABC exporter subunit CydC [Marinobacter sp.]
RCAMHNLKPWLALMAAHRGRMTVGAGLILATLLCGLGLLTLSGWFLTETALVGALFALGIQASINLYVPGGGIRFFAVGRTVFRYMERVFNHNTVLQLLTTLRVALFERLSLASRQHRSEQTGAQWLTRLTADIDALDTLYLRLIAPAAMAVVVTLLLVFMAWFFLGAGPALALALLLSAAFVAATVWVTAITRTASGQLSDQQEALRGEVIEHLEGFAELTAAGRTGKNASRLMRRALAHSRVQASIDTRVAWHQALSGLLINLAAVLALWLGLELFAQDQVSGPVLVMMPIALLGLLEVYAMLPEAFGRLGATESAAARLNRDSYPGQANQQAGSLAAPASEGDRAISLDDITVGYPGHAPMLSHFTLHVNAGERVNVVGVSGSGKSTLADIMAGLSTAQRGRVEALPGAYLTQATALFDDTLRANLQLARPDATDGELWRVLELVELAERFAEPEPGLDTWLGNGGRRLSGGEGRRLALARVLLSNAPVVILDEPFTGVDADTRARMTPHLLRWLDGKTVVCLGHGSEALLPADHTVHLN